MKTLGAIVLLIGLVLMVFAVLVYSELRAAATSVMAPAPDSMPLTKMVGPELFDTENTAAKPAELAGMVFNRIYMIGGASLSALALGTFLLVISRSQDRAL